MTEVKNLKISLIGYVGGTEEDIELFSRLLDKMARRLEKEGVLIVEKEVEVLR